MGVAIVSSLRLAVLGRGHHGVMASGRFSAQQGGWREVDRGSAPSERRSDRSGVALPTHRQAKVWMAMTPEARQEVHERFFPHRQQGCPLEAAFSRYADKRSLRISILMFGVIVAVGVGVFVAFPHAQVWDHLSNGNVTLRSVDVLLTTMVIVIPGSMTFPRLLRERASSARLARLGPDCNPWQGLELQAPDWLPVQAAITRRNIMWMLGLRRSPPP